MPFLEHLDELRRVILTSLAAWLICSIAAYVLSGRALDHIVQRTVGEAQFLHPMEAFNARLKLALLGGLILSLPFIAFQFWSFILPGLYARERRVVLPMTTASTLLFLAGVGFSYWFLTPLMLRLLMEFGTTHVRANITVAYLLDFLVKLAVGTGLMFQLPVVVVILTMIRVVTPRFLWSKWRHAILAIVIISSVVTPGDGALSTLVLAGPILVLYFLSALLSTLIHRGMRKREADAERAADEAAETKEEGDAREGAEAARGVTGAADPAAEDPAAEDPAAADPAAADPAVGDPAAADPVAADLAAGKAAARAPAAEETADGDV